MKSWQYWDAKYIYTGVVLMTIPLMLRHRMTWFHLIYTNQNMDYGGMEIGSKAAIMDLFRKSPCFLPHHLLPSDNQPAKNIALCKEFMERHALDFPLIAKPDFGCVGYGVRKIFSYEELGEILQHSPVPYQVQQYCDYPEEYSIYFLRLPGEEKGTITGVTQKIIPTVTGDGHSTLRELIIVIHAISQTGLHCSNISEPLKKSLRQR